MANQPMASKPQQILQLTPPTDITFVGPFDQVVTSYLELYNPSETRIGFKVKTTAPRRYCVRPNCGVVEPDSKVKIAIMLQPIEDDNQAERNKHKFMVQSTIIQEGVKDLETIWYYAKSDEVMDSKLKCLFHMPETNEGQGVAPQITPQVSSSTVSNTRSSSTAAPIASATSTTTPSLSGTAAPIPSVSSPQTSTPHAKHQQHSSSPKLNQTAGDGPSIRAAAGSSPRKIGAHEISSHNLNRSFLQPVSDDNRIVLLSLAMLIIGVILGKYII